MRRDNKAKGTGKVILTRGTGGGASRGEGGIGVGRNRGREINRKLPL